MPLEPELGEAVVRARQQLVVPTRKAERAKCKRLDDRPGDEDGSLPLDPVVIAERDECVEPRREDPGPQTSARSTGSSISDSIAGRSPRCIAIRSCTPLRYVSYPSPAIRSPSRSSSAARLSSPRQRCARPQSRRSRGLRTHGVARFASMAASAPIRLPRALPNPRVHPRARAPATPSERGGVRTAAARDCRGARPAVGPHRSDRRQLRPESPPRTPRRGDPGRRSQEQGQPGYFLIVWDIVNFCRQQGILVQGRGSAANSAVCYALGITAVDPVGMELLFERFLRRSAASGRTSISICRAAIGASASFSTCTSATASWAPR